MFSITLVNIDSYQAAPIPELDVTFSEFRGSEVRKVPIIRIFGSTSTGKKTCLHVHGAFPYMYVPCTISENMDSYAYQLAASIDSALNTSFGSTASTNQHVYRIQRVSGIPFYGYHEKEHSFFKIYFYNPAIIKRTAELLQNGAILNQNLQPYEAHIPYILQFMIDNNLYGMNVINLNSVKYRHSSQMSITDNSQDKASSNLLDSQAYLQISIARHSMCEFEVDAHASDILNRQSVEKLELSPGLAAIWDEEKARRAEAGLEDAKSQLLYPKMPNKNILSPTTNDIHQEERFLRRLEAISQTNETIISSTNASSYPIEVEDNEHFLNASHVLYHDETFISKEGIEKRIVDNRKSQSASFSEANQSQNHVTDTSLLDADDIQLVEMLADLAEDNEVRSNVDGDSVLGSQYSVHNLARNDPEEEEEVEDLNITSLDLGSLSSWESVHKSSNRCVSMPETMHDENKQKSVEDTNIIDQSWKDVTLIDLPQFDGVYDLSGNTLKYEREILNSSNNVTFTVAQHSSTDIKHMPSINASKEHTYVVCNLHRNLHLMDIIEYIVNNIKGRHLRKQLYNFVNKCHFHIFVKTSKNLQCISVYNFYTDTSVTIEKMHHLQNNNKKIVHNKKIKEELYVTQYQLRLDHRDLDIYDIDEISASENLEDINQYYITNYIENNYIYERDPKLRFQQKVFLNNDRCLNYNPPNLSLKSAILNVDGATATDSSDSEFEADITIDKQEKRICVYKSCKKNAPESTIQITPKKRRLDFNDGHHESPDKRKNTGTRTPRRRCYDSSKVLRSPQCLPGNYSPLDITVVSPKTSKSPIRQYESPKSKQNVPSDVAFTSTTPKRKRDLLRVNLLREKRKTNLLNSNLETDVADDLEKPINIIDTIQNTEDANPIKTSETIGVHELTQRTENNEDSLIKGNKKIRKRLHFLNYDDVENTSTELDHHKSQSKNTVAFGRLIDQAHADAAISLSSNENSEDTEKTNDMSPDREYASNIHKLASKSTKLYEIIPETDFEDDDVLSTTFTQHVNQKMENDSQNLSLERSSCQSAKDVLITITTKYKPPCPDRILASMTLYGIPKCRWEKPFFSNKLDLAKQKESLNANALNFDVAAFKSSLNEITGIKLWRRMKVNEFYPSGSSIKTCHLKRALAGYNLSTIKPLIAPPSSKDVRDWIRAREYLSRKNCNVKSHKKNQEKVLNIKNICDNPPVDIVDVNDRPQTGTSSNHSISNNLNLAGTASLMVQQNILRGVPDDSRKLDHTQNSNDSRSSQVSANILNPSLQKALENSLLYKQNKTEQLGMSYGQIEYSSKGSYGNASSENLKNVRVLTVQRYLTLLSLEVHVITRDDLLPDPQYDPIAALFYAIYNDISTNTNEEIEHGAIIVNPCAISTRLNKIHSSSAMCPILYVATEQDALNSLVNLIEQHNPDILIGWEVEMLSWGYVFHRASHLALNGFSLRISKVPYMQISSKSDAHVFEKDDEIKVPGRNILDVWRIMRHEAALLSYTFENVMHHVLHERIPCPSFKTLSTWWKQESMGVKCRVIRHYVIRVIGTLKILNHLDVIGRTCEHARLFGIQFYEVFSRGSQFRVESMMLRLTKPFNYIPISPSVSQRAKMRAPECLPLIMEPESEFYVDPLIVLDFQSLYPSMIIAYNYCFSTCLGRVEHIGQNGPFEFGAANLRIGKNTALKLKDKINFSPCGVAFVKKEVRQGILPRMLTEILNTRLMVKESMKLYPAENRTLQRALHSQQLGLKLIANVTYGYTSANFSGRMPCIEIGDSIVSKGRETLERAIKLVESTPKWGGRVIYGDTDSLFVLLPGKSREEAFTIGEEIANAVTAINPPPVKLKFEKVLHPSILQTKKRYCGYMYETRDQEKPEFLAKGIETVRRDGCPAVAKMLEKALKILFDTKDVSFVKLYVTRQFDKIFHRRVSIQELTFAKEFRGMHGYKANACVPALELTRRLIRKDPRAVPRVSERVRYIIVAGAPNQALIHCVRTPMEVITDTALIPNSVYYITKVIIPPLNRCFNLLGIDVNTWYKEMSHRHNFDNIVHLRTDNPKSTIRQFFASVMCITCGEQTNKEICAECLSQPNRTILVLLDKIRQLERTYQQITNICHSCIGRLSDVECVSLDCPILYRITQARNELVQVSYMNDIIYGNNSSGIKGVNAVVEWY